MNKLFSIYKPISVSIARCFSKIRPMLKDKNHLILSLLISFNPCLPIKVSIAKIIRFLLNIKRRMTNVSRKK